MAKVINKGQPTLSEVHMNKPLTNISVAYIQDRSEYIAGDVFPEVGVAKASDKYFTYDKNDWFRDEAERRAPSTPSAGGGYNLSDDSYSCDVYAFHKDIDAQTESNYDEPLDADRDATEFVTQRLLLKRDKLFIDNFLTTSVWGTDKQGGDGTHDFEEWNDYSNSDPIGLITGYRRDVKKTTGLKPNRLLIGGQVWDELKDHDDIIDRIKYTREAIDINPALVARAFDLDKIVIAEGIEATNNEGATAAYGHLVGKQALLYYVPSRAALLQPSAGYIFSWTGYAGSNAFGVGMDRFTMRELKARRIEGEMAFDIKQIGSDLGVYLYDVVA